MKRQLFSKTNWGNLTGGRGGKITLNANDFDFELEIQNLVVGADGKKSFGGNDVIVPISKEELNAGLVKGVLDPFVEFFNRVKFKVKDLPTGKTVFANIRIVFKSLYAIRLIGEYDINEKGKNRTTRLEVYKLDSWDQAKIFRNDPTQVAANMMTSFEFEAKILSRGAFNYDDIVTLEELSEIASDCHFRRNHAYTLFLNDVIEETKEKKVAPVSAGEGGVSVTKPASGYQSNVKVDSDLDEDEFPF